MPDIFTLEWVHKDTGALASRAEIEQDYQTVKFSGTALLTLKPDRERITRLRITDQTIDGFVMSKLDSFQTILRGRLPFSGLDGWPADGQLGLFSMAWAIGPLFRFPKFEAAAAAGEWLTMAQECRMTEAGNPGVIRRNVRNELLCTLAGWVAAPPPFDFTQLVFDPTLSLADNMRLPNIPFTLNLVIGLQTALEMLGSELGRPEFEPHGLDGVFCQGTSRALTNFQRVNGLAQTPNARTIRDVGRETIDELVTQLTDTFGEGSVWPPPSAFFP